MDIILYDLDCEDIVIDKSQYMKNSLAVRGTFREGCSLTHPSLLISNDKFHNDYQGLTTPVNYNYLNIRELDRYYYIDNIYIENNGMWRLELTLDPLMSFKDYIYNLNAIISFIENNYDNLMTNDIPTRVKDKYEFISSIEPINLLPGAYGSTYAMISVIGNDNYQAGQSMPYYFNPPLDTFFKEPNGGMSYQGVVNSKYLIKSTVDKPFTDEEYQKSLEYFLHTIYNNDEIFSKVISIRLYPFQTFTFLRDITEEPYFDTSNSFTDERARYGIAVDSNLQPKWSPIYIGGNAVPNDCKGIIVYNTINKKLIDEFIDCTRLDDTYLLYPPYKKYFLYLPYYGKVEIDYYAVVGKYIHIQYIIDYDTGYCTIFISAEETKNKLDDNFNKVGHVNLLYQINTMLGVDIPLNTTNMADIERRKSAIDTQYTGQQIAIGFKGIGAMFQAGANIGAGVATLTPQQAASGVGQFGNAMFSTLGNAFQASMERDAKKSLLVETGTINGNLGNLSNYFGPTSIIFYSISKDIIQPTIYGEYKGYSVEKKVKLNDIKGSGFTVVKYTHLISFTTATKEERDMIESALKNGFII